MKGLFLVGAGLAALCLAVPAVQAADTETVVYNYMAAWNMKDAVRAAGYFAYDVQYFDASMSAPVEGREAAIVSIMSDLFSAMPDAIWGVRGSRIVGDESLAVEWVVSGTNTGIWPDGAMPSGDHVEILGASIFHIVGGKIVYQADYYGGARPSRPL